MEFVVTSSVTLGASFFDAPEDSPLVALINDGWDRVRLEDADGRQWMQVERP